MADNSLNKSSPLILVVDDDRAERQMFRSALENDGYQVIEAENGVEAVELFEKSTPHIILMDIMMPVMSGIDACRVIRGLPGGNRLPLVMISEPEEDDMIHRALNAGVDEFITRPVNFPLLRRRVKLLLRSKLAEESLKSDAEIGLARLQAVLSSMQQGVVFVDVLDRITEINQYACDLVEKKREEIINHSLWKMLPEDTDQRLRNVLEDYKAGNSLAPVSIHNWIRQGEFTITVQPVQKDDHYLGTLLCIIDISPLIEARRTLEFEKCLQDKILQTAATAIYIVNSYGEIVNVNDEFCLITGFDREEILGRHLLMLKSKCQEKCVFFDTARTEPILKHQCTMTSKDGRLLSILKNINILRDDRGHFTGGIVSFIDITKIVEAKEEAERAREHAEHLASVDYLTGLLNRRVFMERLGQEVDRARRESSPVGIILADIDGFKKVNDTYGHQAGDVVLQVFASRISCFSRSYDFVGRYGGEEFITCLPGANCEQTLKIAERTRLAVQEQCIPLPGCDCINITASFGVACIEPGSDANVDWLIARADEALYRAKSGGRNRVCL
ncbi:GGDEF domain-containing response regulator [Desulfocucumis palustris]|nr:diguanylate cyclase [Desulfocucumis palustris]